MAEEPHPDADPTPLAAAPEITPDMAPDAEPDVALAKPARQRRLSALEQRFAVAFAELGVVSAAALRAGYAESYALTSAYRLMRRARVRMAIAEARDALAREEHMRFGRAMAADVSQGRVIAELAKLAFADPRDLFTADGKLKPIHELDDGGAANIAALDVVVTTGRRAPTARAPAKTGAARATAARAKTGRGKTADAADMAADAPGEVVGGSAIDASADDAAVVAADAIDPAIAGQVLELRKIKCWDKTRALELLGRTLGLFKDRLDAGTAQDLAAGIEAARQRARALRDKAPVLMATGEGDK
jgi:phage terminase small subunit